MNIIAVSACAAGIAHTYMAAEGLKKAARKTGDKIKVEIQGSMGLENELTKKDIENADFVIFATDIAVRGSERFADKKVVEIRPHDVIAHPIETLEKAKQEVK